MSFDPESRYPSRRTYVVKLRSDATRDTLAGRVENLVTGTRRDFTCAGELVECIAADVEPETQARG